jgi:hypothetical protein
MRSTFWRLSAVPSLPIAVMKWDAETNAAVSVTEVNIVSRTKFVLIPAMVKRRNRKNHARKSKAMAFWNSFVVVYPEFTENAGVIVVAYEK